MADLVVALDYTDALDAFNMAAAIRDDVHWVKVGLELFTREGTKAVQTVKGMGLKVMLDLKMFDIPHTVQGGVRAASWIGADLLTLHLLGGEKMARAAVEEARLQEEKTGKRPLLFGVTVLTSMEEGDLLGFTGSIGNLATDLAARATEWGLDGVVCSGFEVAAIKQRCPDCLCLTPGIRLETEERHDQRRVMTPAQAVAEGSDFLVVGRPVTGAVNPAAAARSILADMNGAGTAGVNN